MKPVTDASAWTAASLGGIEGLTHRLGPAHLQAFDEAIRATQGKAPGDVAKADFDSAALRELMAAVKYELVAGRGAILLTGFDPSRYSPDAFKRLYFGLGAHLGTAAPQSPRGDVIGLVQHEPNPDWRGYLTDAELNPHTDFHELMSLAMVTPAASGGASGLVSSVAIYNTVLAERPQLLAALMEGFYYPVGQDGLTDYKVPTVSVVDGKVSIFNYPLFIPDAARIMGEPVPQELVDGLRFIAEVSRRPEMRVMFEMQPGDMVFWHNFTVQHSRTAFTNSDTQKRRLLRLWLHSDQHRPMARGYLEMAQLLDESHLAGHSMLVNTPETLKAAAELFHRG